MGDPEMYLHEMGFSDYETTAYLALLENGTGTANEVAKAGDIPQSRVYDILEKLEKKGFVVTQPGRPKKFGPVSPESAIEQFGEYKEEQFESEYEKVMLAGEQFVECAEATTEARGASDEPEIIWSYHTEHQMFEVFEQLCRRADDDVRMLTRVENVERKVGKFSDMFADLSAQGVRIRVIIPKSQTLSNSIHRNLVQYADLAQCTGVEAQIYLFDEEAILIVFRNDGEFVGLTVQNQALGKTMTGMYDILWESVGARVEPPRLSE